MDVSWRAAGSGKAGDSRSVRLLVPQRSNSVPDSYVHRPIFQARLRFALFSVVIGRLLTGSPVQL